MTPPHTNPNKLTYFLYRKILRSCSCWVTRFGSMVSKLVRLLLLVEDLPICVLSLVALYQTRFGGVLSREVVVNELAEQIIPQHTSLLNFNRIKKKTLKNFESYQECECHFEKTKSPP